MKVVILDDLVQGAPQGCKGGMIFLADENNRSDAKKRCPEQ